MTTDSQKLQGAFQTGQVFTLPGSRYNMVAYVGTFQPNSYKLLSIPDNYPYLGWYTANQGENQIVNLLEGNGYVFDENLRKFTKDNKPVPTFHEVFAIRANLPAVRTVHVYTPGPNPSFSVAGAPTKQSAPELSASEFGNTAMGKAINSIVAQAPIFGEAQNKALDNVITAVGNLSSAKTTVIAPSRNSKGHYTGHVLPPRNKRGHFLPLRDVLSFTYNKDGEVSSRRVVFDDKRSDNRHVRGVDLGKKAYRCFSRAKIKGVPVISRQYVDLTK